MLTLASSVYSCGWQIGIVVMRQHLKWESFVNSNKMNLDKFSLRSETAFETQSKINLYVSQPFLQLIQNS